MSALTKKTELVSQVRTLSDDISSAKADYTSENNGDSREESTSQKNDEQQAGISGGMVLLGFGLLSAGGYYYSTQIQDSEEA
jgi:hypothetical protein